MHTQSIEFSRLRRHPQNTRVRDECSKSEVSGLAKSIREHGLLQPLVVTPDGDNYTILAGHRRHAALKVLGVTEVPCNVVDADDARALAILVADNGQHRPVDPLREAEAVGRLVESLGDADHPLDRAANVLGKGPSWVRGRLRLLALTNAWRAAFANESHPVHEFPVGHLEVVAALPPAIQDQMLSDHEGWFRDGVPLAAELRRTVAGYTRELGRVPWDVDAPGLVPDAPACSACPRRDSAQGGLFASATDTGGDRCLDSVCFEAKKRAAVLTALTQAREKHGPSVVVQVSWGFDATSIPEGVLAYREFELIPLAKSKGGKPTLRLRDMKVAFMGLATQAVTPGRGEASGNPERPAGPKTLDERRQDLEKRRLVRALTLFRGSLLGQPVEVGTERHPEQVTPPNLSSPALPDLLAVTLAFGTGRSVDEGATSPWEQSAADRLAHAIDLIRPGADGDGPRGLLWGLVREPVSRVINPLPGATRDAIESRVAVARAIAQLCGVSWEEHYAAPAVEAIPEPKSWARMGRLQS